MLVKVNNSEVYNPSDLMVDGSTAVSELTVKRNGEIKVLPVNFTGDKFFEEVLKYPPFLRKAYFVDQNANRFVVTPTKGQVDFKHSLEELATMENIKTLYVYPVVAGEDLSSDSVKVDLNAGKEMAIEFTDLQSLIMALDSRGLRSIDLMVRSVNMGSPADKVGIKSDDVFATLEGKKSL